MNIIAVALFAFLVMLGGFLLFLPLLPLAALFFMWLWNDVATYLHVPYAISYWESLKLCFFLYVLKGIFSARAEISRRDA